MPPRTPIVRQQWTTEEHDYLRRTWAEGVHIREICRALNRSRGSVSNQAQRLDLHRPPVEHVPAPLAPPKPPVDPIEAERERQERARQIREEREAVQALAGERSLRSMLTRLFEDCAAKLPSAPAYREPKPTKGTTRETLVLHLSDWHYGEIVEDEATRGFNVYNATIAAERARAVVRSVRAIAEKMRAGGGWQFPRLVVALNGDLVTGTIHELERHSQPANIVWSVYECGLLLSECIRDLAASFPVVDVYATSGNHGRLPDARRMQSKDPTRNWDTLVALFAKTALANVKGVTVTIPQSYAVSYEVEGVTVLQSHGHDIKSWSGIPWYGINRFLGNYNGLEASRGGQIGAYLFGHFHSQTNLTYPGGEAFVNGSLISGTEWTINALGRSDRPSQTLLAVHADHGVSHRWPIYADAGKPQRKTRA